ncbi:MAG TPA: ATP-binding protein, partial [Actinomycetota bacterium]|nr:ATP-binding protein [Actinomycetota bacterium]
MAEDGVDRFSSCGAFVGELQRALAGSGVPSEAASRSALPPELDPVGPLFGREQDLAWLARMWRESTGREGIRVLVAGVRGIGKTRLAAEFARTAHLGGASVGYASCIGPADAAVREIFSSGTGTGPRLLVIDDADAADVATARAFAELGANAGVGLMVLATCRDAGAPTTSVLLGTGAPEDRIRQLEPLDAGAMARIFELYAPGTPARTADRILAHTRGVPLLVHQTVTEWVREGSVRRLDEEAAAARGLREELRASEDAVADRVRDLQLATERVETVARDAEDAAAGPALGVCPFRGLAPFDVGDAEFFFGRERLVGTLVARLVGTAVLAVVGPSGSGKSSIVRAGLVPALASGALPGSDGWPTVVIRPGERPGAELEAGVAAAGFPGTAGHGVDGLLSSAAAGLPLSAKLVLVVDQFEEVFTTCRDEGERDAFIDGLIDAATRPNGRCAVVIAIRADYYGRCAAYPRLADLVATNQVLIGPMDRRELRHAIELPAERAGLRVEEELTEALVEDVSGQPGGLPLLSTALLELWERRDGRWLRASEYARSGRVEAAVARLAERTYERLTPDRRETARAILLRLTGPGEGDEVVRRRVPLAEFGGEGAEERRAVLDVLAASRLVTISEGTVEVAHEALLREWPRLRGWLEQDVQGRATHRHLISAARDWDERGRDAADLYRGARLASAVEWVEAHPAQPNDLEAEFLARSVSASDVERASSRRSVRRLRALLAGL